MFVQATVAAVVTSRLDNTLGTSGESDGVVASTTGNVSLPLVVAITSAPASPLMVSAPVPAVMLSPSVPLLMVTACVKAVKVMVSMPASPLTTVPLEVARTMFPLMTSAPSQR